MSEKTQVLSPVKPTQAATVFFLQNFFHIKEKCILP